MEIMKRTCTGRESELADLLLDPAAVPAKVRVHVEQCEPSLYFLSRLDSRVREERQAAPEGWWARLRDRFTYGPALHVRPLAAMALTVALLIGGGAYLSVSDMDQSAKPSQDAAVVHDLQTLDNNAQLLDQMEAVSTPPDNGD
jgi:hypothetical protein